MPGNPRVEQDHDLIRRMASKDVTALDAFYERYNRLAFSLVLRIVGNRSDAEDVLVDVFWQVWQESAAYDTSRSKPVAWLLAIARTRAIDARRSTVTQAVLKPDDLVDSDIGRAVQQALQELSEEQRAPMEMAYFQGMSHAQIASTLKEPPETVKERIRRSMTHLRKRLEAYLR
jgi:RNA polymerase sigma-70 factor, ECF subfamily